MKFIAFAAILSVVNGAARPVGDPCSGVKDDCGVTDKTYCCGVFTLGKVCTDVGCLDVSSLNVMPNTVGCNTVAAASDYVMTQGNSDATSNVFAKFLGANFKCIETPTEKVNIIM